MWAAVRFARKKDAYRIAPLRREATGDKHGPCKNTSRGCRTQMEACGVVVSSGLLSSGHSTTCNSPNMNTQKATRKLVQLFKIDEFKIILSLCYVFSPPIKTPAEIVST